MQNALPCDKPHKGGRDSTVHIQTGPQTAPSAPKSMQQRDAGHAPRVLPSSAAQLPVDAALNAHDLTLLMVLLYAFFRPIATTTPIIFPNSQGRFLAGCTIPAYTKSPPVRLVPEGFGVQRVWSITAHRSAQPACGRSRCCHTRRGTCLHPDHGRRGSPWHRCGRRWCDPHRTCG